MKIIKGDKVIDTSKLEKDPVAGEVEIKKVEPRRFIPGEKVTTLLKTHNNITIPQGVVLTISQIVSDNMYNVLGPDGLVLTISGAYLEKVKED